MLIPLSTQPNTPVKSNKFYLVTQSAGEAIRPDDAGHFRPLTRPLGFLIREPTTSNRPPRLQPFGSFRNAIRLIVPVVPFNEHRPNAVSDQRTVQLPTTAMAVQMLALPPLTKACSSAAPPDIFLFLGQQDRIMGESCIKDPCRPTAWGFEPKGEVGRQTLS